MASFSISLGPCEACKDSPATFGIGPLCCTACGAVLENLCPRCAKRPCPNCKGELLPKDRVFPHSAFKAISKADTAELKTLLCQNITRIAAARIQADGSLLHAAARAKGKDVAASMCRILLENGVAPTITDQHGRTALHEAVRLRVFNREVASLLSSAVNMQDNEGGTALMFAAEGAGLFGSRRGNIAIARELLALGADPNLQDGSGKTALGYAMASNDTDRNGEIISLLEHAMLSAAAIHEFNKRYAVTFAKNTGVLVAEPRVPMPATR